MVMTPVTAMESWNVCHIKDVLAEKGDNHNFDDNRTFRFMQQPIKMKILWLCNFRDCRWTGSTAESSTSGLPEASNETLTWGLKFKFLTLTLFYLNHIFIWFH